MINKMRPDLLNDRMRGKGGERVDVRRIEDGDNVVTDILKEKGVIKEGQMTIFDFIKSKQSIKLKTGEVGEEEVKDN
jgi:hypothetical protein